MKILIKTKIEKNYLEVKNGFNLELFKALKPPFIKLDVERFDGCKKGDEVHLKVGVGPITQKWVSLITDDWENEEEWLFIDEGSVLPPPLKQWTHHHRVKILSKDSCEIQDDINYSTGNTLLDFLIYPALYFQFLIRKPVYKRMFQP